MTEINCACSRLSAAARLQSVADVLFLQGVDLGIVRPIRWTIWEKKGFAKDIKKQVLLRNQAL